MKVAVIEDDREIAGQICDYVEKYGAETGRIFEIVTYDDGLMFLDSFRSQYDIILMDIELPTINGMETSAKVRQADNEVVIIFITYMAQFAVKGYEVQALDFIVKPVAYSFFAQKFRRAVVEAENKKSESIIVKTAAGFERLAVSKIKYVEVSGHNMLIHMVDRDLTLRCSIKEMEEKLKDYHFLRCNVCYLLNPVFIDKVSQNMVMVDNVSLPISRPKKKEFLKGLAEYFNSSRRE